MIVKDRLFIDGEWVTPASTQQTPVISPATEEQFAAVPATTAADIDHAVHAARTAFDQGPWPRMSASERADAMAALSVALQARYDEIAQTITSENGCPISWSGPGQVFASTYTLDYYTGLAREYAFEEQRRGLLGPVVVRRE